jgi:hypothetical protein
VLPFDLVGRHRAPGPRVRVALRLAIPRHSELPSGAAVTPATRTKWWFFAVLVLVALGVGPVRPGGAAPPAAISPPAPAVIAPPAPSAVPSSHLALQRRRTISRRAAPTPSPAPAAAKTTAPVLLGPADLGGSLNAYCRQGYGQLTAAFVTRDGWVCVALLQRPQPIVMGAFCRSLYGSRAVARLTDTHDQWSWLCYRGAS